MRFLLDTHALVWAASAPDKLGSAARHCLTEASQNDLAIAGITLLEVAMLATKGRIICHEGVEKSLKTMTSKVRILSIDHSIAATAMELPLPQGDPFDRVIVACALRHQLPLLSADRAITLSGLVPIIW